MGDALKHDWLRNVANATLAYPLVFTALWYGHWFLAWQVLEHQPVPWEDDPKFIDGARWMFDVTAFAFIGLPLIAMASLTTNIGHIVVNRATAAQAGFRLLMFVALWMGMYVLCCTDPYYPIAKWWID